MPAQTDISKTNLILKSRQLGKTNLTQQIIQREIQGILQAKIPPLKPVQIDPQLLRVWGLGKRDNSASALADWMAVMDAERVEREEKAARDAIPEYPGVWPPPLLGFPRG